MKTINTKTAAMTLLLMSAGANAIAGMAVEQIDGSFPAQAFSDQNNLIQPVAAFSPDQVAQYDIRTGETMKVAMERWTKTVGYTLVWQPAPEDGDIKFARGMTFENSFNKASDEFFEIVRGQSKFDAQLHANGVLRVFVADSDK